LIHPEPLPIWIEFTFRDEIVALEATIVEAVKEEVRNFEA
jgi:hypothetical protein